VAVPGELLGQLVAAGASPNLPQQMPMMVPIESPLVLGGFTDTTLEAFGPMFQQMGISPVQGGGGNSIHTTKPAAGWENSLKPGETVAGVLVDGDMSVAGLGTVTYNDGKRVLAFGHSFFNLGPVDMPMSKGEVLMTLASSYQPNKMANATEIVGALRQDRHSGIEGALGAESQMIPVAMKVRSLDEKEAVRRERDFHFNVFVQQRWTPYLMMLTLYNSLSELNEFAEEATYRLSGKVEIKGQHNISLSTMQASGEVPMPAPLMLAGWWGDKFNRLYLNNVKTPQVSSVNVTVDLLPERRVAAIESAWAPISDVRAGDEVPVKVLLRPYRGEPFIQSIPVTIPEQTARGTLQLVISDAEFLNRNVQFVAASSQGQLASLEELIQLLNREHHNDRLYATLLQPTPTVLVEDKEMPNVPASAISVLDQRQNPGRARLLWESTAGQWSVPMYQVITGQRMLTITVK
jgi:hypothetical protein